MTSPLRQALHSLRHRPAYTTICASLLALSVAAVTAIFSVVDVAVFRPLPYPTPSRLAWLAVLEPHRNSTTESGLVALQLVRWRRENQAFESLEGAQGGSASLTGEGDPEAVPGLAVSAGFLSLLGGAPFRGRGFTRDEEISGSTVAIVSYEFWQRRLGGRDDVLGHTITLDGIPRAIIGVTPRGFSVFFGRTDVFVPLPLDPVQWRSRYRAIMGVGRLKRGVTIAQAMDDLNRSNNEIAREVAVLQKSRAAVRPLRDALFGPTQTPLLMLSGAVLLLVLIACANIANLTLSDGLARRHATMTRLAMGASPARVISLRLRETALIAVAAGAAGLCLGRLALTSLRIVNRQFFDGFGTLSLDGRGVAIALVTSFGVAFLAVLPGTFTEARLNLAGLVSGAARGVGTKADQGVREALMMGQVAIALILLLGSALLIKDLRSLNSAPQGFAPEHLLAVKVETPARDTSQQQRSTFFQQVVAAIGRLPGVETVSGSQSEFALGGSSRTFFAIDGIPLVDSVGLMTNFRHVLPDIFRVQGTALREGRALDARDRDGAEMVAVVNESFARVYLNGHAIGARLRRTYQPNLPWMTVVGVVEDVKDDGLGVDLGPTLYVPYLQENQLSVSMTVLARLAGDAVPTDQSVQRAVWSVDGTPSIRRIALIETLERESAAEPRFQALVVSLFGTGALVLVIGGIYALTLFSVLRRTREFGVRAALGASPRDLVTNGVWRGLRPVLWGLALGALLAIPVLGALGRTLHQDVTVGDIPLFTVVLLALVVASAIAAFLPAQRATRIAPVVALQG